ncbi:hypothetical protein D3C74_245640 [compost metagenome]
MKLSMESLFGDEDIEIECPSCDVTFKVEFQKILEPGSIVVCSGCGQEIELNHDETTEKTLKDANKSLNEFNKSFDKMAKAFKKF